MTGLHVVRVDVHVQGVSFEKENNALEAGKQVKLEAGEKAAKPVLMPDPPATPETKQPTGGTPGVNACLGPGRAAMKIRVLDRILVFFAGIVLLLTGAGVIAERLPYDVPVFDTLADMLFESLTVVIVAAAVLVLLGVYCVCMMFRRYKGKRGFVVQRTEGGELSISIKAIENLVQKCIDKHEELHVMSTGLENSRNGLVIKLRIGLASGVSIPLVVSALQKQIKQYVTACSGVDVREVKVQVETASANLKDSPFAVPDLLATPVTEKLATTTQEPASVKNLR